ncbi:hypothetical protein C482_19319 [Natrialba chahannaoensis JCM 10990]|uniref:Uncharacterized protein n=1 Tax=Natrialba chahannaoensis JCM 10990 TaxID=1227492 RepID=M0A4C8_9EURY|nr:DUF5812 family protein [Natrialba chahannaoensis]ELY93580.1 hypothetical protein C482_19319 [Natrialba chahannaoensis JCM 10990]
MTETETGSENEKTGTFVVTHAEDESAVVRDVDTAQIHTLGSNPGLDANDVLEATVAPEPPLEVTWQVIEVAERRRVELVDSDLSPTQHEAELAADAETGDLIQEERAGTGEIHVFRVPAEEVEAAAQDVLEDEETIARAARLNAVRVEVRRTTGLDAIDDGVLSVRYLPD